MKRYGNWVVVELLRGTPSCVNLDHVMDVGPDGDNDLYLYQALQDTDGDQCSLNIKGTMAEWLEVVVGVPPPERYGWFRPPPAEDPTGRTHAPSGRCVFNTDAGWFVWGEEASSEEMEPRYGCRVDAMVAVEAWWTAKETP